MSLQDQFDRAFRLHQQGKLREAFLRYDAVLAAKPDHAPALHYSGVVLMQAGKHEPAIERIRASLQLEANSADAWSNLAIALQAVDQPDAALEALRRAAEIAPDSAEIWGNLASAQLTLQQAGDAERSARRAVAVDGRFAMGWYHLALALDAQGRVLEALDAASRASALAPDEPATSGLKAQLQQRLGQMPAARATLEAALARRPAAATLRSQLAALLQRQGDRAGAAREFGHALRLQPGNDAVLSQLLFLRKELADWADLGDLQQRFRQGVAGGRPMLTPFSFLSDPSTRAEQRACAENWTKSIVDPTDKPRRLLSAGRLKIGYLSGDFYDHPTAVLAAGVFEAHDRTRVEVFGYSTGPDDGSRWRKRVTAAFDHFVDSRESTPARLAESIRAAGIDILVDLKGHTGGAPLEVLARRPAPIQVHWLGYPGTLGGRVADYLIGDPVVTPLVEAPDYAEQLVILPGSYQSNDRSRVEREPPPRAALGLPARGTIFCCFNATYKLNPDVLNAWAAILAAVPEGVLWLLARDDGDPAIANLRREAAARAIAPERLVFASRRAHADYLGLYRHADLFLDTWPYNAHTTAGDALWMGCPVLTRRGETFAGRVAESLLRTIGLPDLVVADTEAYVRTAIALAGSPERRAALAADLVTRGRSSRLFDATAFARNLERAYAEMAGQFRTGRRGPIVLTDAGA